MTDENFELGRVANDDGCLGGQQGGDDIAEVPSVGAERDGGAVGGRFDHVLAAAVAEAAADKGDVCRAPPCAKLADGIDEEDRPAIGSIVAFLARIVPLWKGAGIGVESRAAQPRQLRHIEQLGDGVEAFGVTRYEDKAQPGIRPRQPFVDVEGDLFFGFLSTAGEKNDVVSVESRELA